MTSLLVWTSVHPKFVLLLGKLIMEPLILLELDLPTRRNSQRCNCRYRPDRTIHSRAVDHAERMVGIQISEVYVGISGNHIGLQSSHGVVAVSNEDREIGEEDIDRVLKVAEVVALPPDREIIDVVAKQFVVDGLEGISDPRGMIGVRLEVEATIITGAKTAIHNLLRCVEKSGLKVKDLVLIPLGAGQLALSKDEKTMGSVLVDVGAGSTTLAVFEGGGLPQLRRFRLVEISLRMTLHMACER